MVQRMLIYSTSTDTQAIEGAIFVTCYRPPEENSDHVFKMLRTVWSFENLCRSTFMMFNCYVSLDLWCGATNIDLFNFY